MELWNNTEFVIIFFIILFSDKSSIERRLSALCYSTVAVYEQ